MFRDTHAHLTPRRQFRPHPQMKNTAPFDGNSSRLNPVGIGVSSSPMTEDLLGLKQGDQRSTTARSPRTMRLIGGAGRSFPCTSELLLHVLVRGRCGL